MSIITPTRAFWFFALFGSSMLLVAIRPTPVYACTCMPPTTHTERMNRASAVFAGKLLVITPPPGGKPPRSWKLEWTSSFPFLRFTRPFRNFGGMPRLTFAVQEVWKGPALPQMTFESAVQNGINCGYWWEEGKEYLVYAPGDQAGVNASGCTGTVPLAEAGEHLTLLAAGRRPIVPTAKTGMTPPAQPLLLASLALLVLVSVLVYRSRSRPVS